MRNLSLLLLVLMAGSLQGCFPVVATGVGTGVMMAQDRRSNSVFIDDEKIEIKAMDIIGKQIKADIHVNVTSYNRKVLITGEVPDESILSEISKIVTDIERVVSVNNELVVAPNSSLASRSNDSLITTNVKLRMMKDDRFNEKSFSANHVKVVTENGTVFLSGIVDRAEAAAAADVASGTTGVKRVVKLFEYFD